MGLFRRKSHKPLPAGAVVADGVATWQAGDGKRRTGPVVLTPDGRPQVVIVEPGYTMRYRDPSGRTVTVSTGCKDRSAAQQVYARKLRELELLRAGILTPAELDRGRARAESVSSLADLFERAMLDRGGSPAHAIETARYVRRVAEGVGAATLRDLTREVVETYLGRIRDAGASARSRNAHAVALGTFGTWLHRTGRAEVNPYGGIPRLNERANRVRERRALTEDEIVRLLAAARNHYLASVAKMSPNNGPVRKVRPEVRERRTFRGMARELYYSLALTTGLRAGELAGLRVADVDLAARPPTVTVRAEESKNGRQATLPLHPEVAGQIGRYMADRLRLDRAEAARRGLAQPLRIEPSARLLTECPTLRSFEADCRAADIPLRDDAGRRVDRHSMRHTFCTRLARGGASVAVAQRLMRHSDPKITMGFYTHLDLGDLAEGVACLPVAKEAAGHGIAK